MPVLARAAVEERPFDARSLVGLPRGAKAAILAMDEVWTYEPRLRTIEAPETGHEEKLGGSVPFFVAGGEGWPIDEEGRGLAFVGQWFDPSGVESGLAQYFVADPGHVHFEGRGLISVRLVARIVDAALEQVVLPPPHGVYAQLPAREIVGWTHHPEVDGRGLFGALYMSGAKTEIASADRASDAVDLLEARGFGVPEGTTLGGYGVNPQASTYYEMESGGGVHHGVVISNVFPGAWEGRAYVHVERGRDGGLLARGYA